MSKQLTKIISILALVILLPLVIVGASLTVTEAVGCTLTVVSGGYEGKSEKPGTYPLTSSVKILVDGKELEDPNATSVKVGKYSKITLQYSGTGYDFDGWYEGSYYAQIKDEKDPLDDKEEYTFELKKDTTICAVRDIKTYHVTYTGIMDDLVTPVSVAAQDLEYNDALATVNPVNNGTFGGWDLTSDTTTDGVLYANFPTSGEVTVSAVWDDIMNIKFVVDNTKEFTIPVSRATIEGGSFTLPNTENENVTIPAGYEFVGWIDAEGNPVESIDEFDANGKTLYLKKNAITFNITVKDNAEAAESIATLTYNVETNGTKVPAIVAEKEHYTLKRVKLGEAFYTNDEQGLTDLASAILAKGEKNVTLTAEWELTTVNVTVKYHAKSETTDTIVYNNATHTFSEYARKRSHYTLKAFELDGQKYNYVNGEFNGLAEAIMAKNSTEVEVTAVWECDFDAVTFNLSGLYDNDGDEENVKVDGEWLEEEGTIVAFSDYEPETEEVCHDLTDDIIAAFLGGKNVVTKTDSAALKFNGVVRVTCGVFTQEYNLNGAETLTYEDILTIIPEANLTAEGEVSIVFMFELDA